MYHSHVSLTCITKLAQTLILTMGIQSDTIANSKLELDVKLELGLDVKLELGLEVRLELGCITDQARAWIRCPVRNIGPILTSALSFSLGKGWGWA